MKDAISLLQMEQSRLIAGSTDVGVQINKGRHSGQRFLDLRLISALYSCEETDEGLTIGARVTLTHLRDSLQKNFPDYAEYMNLFASPQIRNMGTLVGNVANASPIADSTPYLLMANARIGINGPRGYREVPMTEFYLGYKALAMDKEELIQQIILPKPHPDEFIRIYKISARRDLDIACVNLSASIRLENDVIVDCRLAFGGVGGIAIGLAAQDVCKNMFGGFTIYFDRPFSVGDWIRSPDRKPRILWLSRRRKPRTIWPNRGRLRIPKRRKPWPQKATRKPRQI